MLPRSANPEHPNEVAVSRPSDVLTAKRATETTLEESYMALTADSVEYGADA